MLTKPVVYPEIRQEVPHKQVGPAEVAADKVQGTANDCDAEIAEGNELGVFGFVEWGSGVEVVHTSTKPILLALAATLLLKLVVVVAMLVTPGEGVGSNSEKATRS